MMTVTTRLQVASDLFEKWFESLYHFGRRFGSYHERRLDKMSPYSCMQLIWECVWCCKLSFEIVRQSFLNQPVFFVESRLLPCSTAQSTYRARVKRDWPEIRRVGSSHAECASKCSTVISCDFDECIVRSNKSFNCRYDGVLFGSQFVYDNTWRHWSSRVIEKGDWIWNSQCWYERVRMFSQNRRWWSSTRIGTHKRVYLNRTLWCSSYVRFLKTTGEITLIIRELWMTELESAVGELWVVSRCSTLCESCHEVGDYHLERIGGDPPWGR